MDVGYVVNAFYPVNGGTESYFLDLAKYVSKHHNVRVYTTNVKSSENFRIVRSDFDTIRTKHHMIDKIDVYRSKITQIPFIQGERFVNKFTQSYRANQKTQSILSRQVTFFLNWGFSFGICKHLLQDKLDIIQYTSLPFLHTYTDGFISRLREIPSVFFPAFHRGSDHEAFLNRVPFQLATKVVVYGINEKEDIKRLFRVPDWKIEMIPLGLVMDQYSIKIKQDFFPELKTREGIPKVLFIGRLTHTKGFIFLAQTMIELWKKGINVDFIYVGIPTIESQSIEPHLRRYGEHVFHYQNIPHEAKVQLLRTCDMLILPSIVESWGLVFMEGWSQRKPVIGVTNQSYEREFLKNGINGFTVPFMNKKILADRILSLIQDKELRKRLGEAGYKLLSEKYTMDAVFPKYLKLYEDISNNRQK